MSQISEYLNVTAAVAQVEEEEFFDKMKNQLHDLCEYIAMQCLASSAAIFFATEEPRGGASIMVMRGAFGRLLDTYEAGVEARKKGYHEVKGFAYPSQLDDEFFKLSSKEQAYAIKQWPVTNQIWHLAAGRIANSNRAMDGLFARDHATVRIGLGDSKAYPAKRLATTFRNMVGVPIFAEGGGSPVIETDHLEETGLCYPSSGSARREFLSRYRVIGILKVEGKLPACSAFNIADTLSRLSQSPDYIKLDTNQKKNIKDWCVRLAKKAKKKDFLKVFSAEKFGPILPKEIRPDKNQPKNSHLRKALADAITESCAASFTRNDTELLGLQAMQIGRLLSLRVIKYAATKGIVIGESEVGLLNVRWHDVEELDELLRAAAQMQTKIDAYLRQLKACLDFEKRCQVFRARVSELLDIHGPIQRFEVRRKEPLSLIHKMIRKHRKLEEHSQRYEIVFGALKADLEGYGHLSGENFIGRGYARLFLERPEIGKAEVDAIANLGIRDAPHLRIRQQHVPVAVCQSTHRYEQNLPLVCRILDSQVYGIDDLCAARIITDYGSDIDTVLDQLRVQSRRWGFELTKIDDQRDGGEDGYRGVHVTLQIDIDSHDPQWTKLCKVLPPLPLKVPIEVQLRTAYQDSWAVKTHSESYKRESFIPPELRDESEILSNVLCQADRLSDIVKGAIQDSLLPPDFGERKLVEYLRPRLPSEDLVVLQFGLDCIREAMENHLRYTGQPEYSFAVEICQKLVYNFGVLDPNMLLLSLLRHIWRKSEFPITEGRTLASEKENIVAMLSSELSRWCSRIVNSYRNRLPVSEEERLQPDWLRLWLERLPPWFWAMQWSYRSYFLQTHENRAMQWKQRLQDVFFRLQRHYSEGGLKNLDDSLERAYIVEAAVLLASLAELPAEPGRKRRLRQYHQYVGLFHEIRRYLPNGPIKWRVTAEVGRALRAVNL